VSGKKANNYAGVLMEDHRLRVFENRMLRKVFGSKRDGKTE
jgi:hypothetical protein